MFLNVSITSLSAHRAPRQRLYNFKRANFDQFRDVLSSIRWDCCFLEGGIEEAWNKFKDLFLAAADQCIPSFTLRRTRTKSWLSDEVLSLIKKKRRAYRIAKRTGKLTHQCRYKSLSRNLTRRDQNLHIKKITNNLLKDQKPFWCWLKNTKGGHRSIPDIHHQGNILSSALEKANALNIFFSSVFSKEITSNIDSLHLKLLPSKSSAEITNVVFTSDDVYELLCVIDPSKSSGPDNIPGRLFKEGAPWIAEPLKKAI